MSNPTDISAGAIFLAIGAFLAFHTLETLRIGTANQPGPGLFPLVLSILLALLGLAIIAGGILSGQSTAAEPIPDSMPEEIPWRGILLVMVSIIVLGTSLIGLGMVPAIFVSAVLSSFASRQMTLPLALMLSVGLTVFCILAFYVGLDVNLKLFGPWIRG